MPRSLHHWSLFRLPLETIQTGWQIYLALLDKNYKNFVTVWGQEHHKLQQWNSIVLPIARCTVGRSTGTLIHPEISMKEKAKVLFRYHTSVPTAPCSACILWDAPILQTSNCSLPPSFLSRWTKMERCSVDFCCFENLTLTLNVFHMPNHNHQWRLAKT